MVADSLGRDGAEALAVGGAQAGVTVHGVGVRLDFFELPPARVAEQSSRLKQGETVHVQMVGRAIPAAHTPAGFRAVAKDAQRIRTWTGSGGWWPCSRWSGTGSCTGSGRWRTSRRPDNLPPPERAT